MFDWSAEEYVLLFTKIRYISRDFAKCLGEDIPYEIWWMIEFLQVPYTSQKNIHNEKIKTNRISYNIVTEVSKVDFELWQYASYYLIKEYLKSLLMLKHYEGTTYLK